MMNSKGSYNNASTTIKPEGLSLGEPNAADLSDEENTEDAPSQSREDREEPNLLFMRKVFNPYLKAWKEVTPLSVPYKAVWRHSPNSKAYEPFCWGNMSLPKQVDREWISGSVANVAKQVGHPPDSNFLWVVTFYFFLVHSPLVYLLTRYFFFAHIGTDSDESEVKQITTTYFAGIVLLTILLVTLHFVLRHKYKKVLLEHELKIQGLLDHFNSQEEMKNMRLVAGKFGAWIELQILHPQYELVGTPTRESQELLYGSSQSRRS